MNEQMIQQKTAWIQDLGGGCLEEEHAAVERVLQEKKSLVVKRFTRKKLFRRQIPLPYAWLIVGDHDVMRQACKYLSNSKKDLPNDCYPTSLRRFLKRHLWTSTTGALLRDASNVGMKFPLFVKPSHDTKKFTGLVVASFQDLYQLQSVSKNTVIYVSDVVQWVSEWRVFVNQSKVVGIQNYDGDPTVRPDQEIILDAVATLAASSDDESTAGYALDFGVLAGTGETALVEWNDGLALGSYGLNAEVYTNLLLARWQELVRQHCIRDNPKGSLSHEIPLPCTIHEALT